MKKQISINVNKILKCKSNLYWLIIHLKNNNNKVTINWLSHSDYLLQHPGLVDLPDYQQIILGFVVWVLHVLYNTNGPVTLAVIVYWAHVITYNTARQILPEFDTYAWMSPSLLGPLVNRASGGIVEAGAAYQKNLSEEVTKLQRLYGGGDLAKFPNFKFSGQYTCFWLSCVWSVSSNFAIKLLVRIHSSNSFKHCTTATACGVDLNKTPCELATAFQNGKKWKPSLVYSAILSSRKAQQCGCYFLHLK